MNTTFRGAKGDYVLELTTGAEKRYQRTKTGIHFGPAPVRASNWHSARTEARPPGMSQGVRAKYRSVKIPRDMPQIGQLRRQILQSIDDQMSHAVLPLQEARGKESSGQAADAAITFPHMGPDNQIGGAGFIFESDECRSLGSSRPLPHENQAGDAIAPVGFHAL
jgi:hypothetical protein